MITAHPAGASAAWICMVPCTCRFAPGRFCLFPMFRAIKRTRHALWRVRKHNRPESLLLIEIFNLDHRKNLNTNVIVLVGVKQVVLNLLPVR